jgi:hypothetical protein
MSGKPIYFKLEFPESYLPPRVTIYAKHDFTFHRLTEDITEALFDEYIDRLIYELKQIQKEGKRKFAEWHSKT